MPDKVVHLYRGCLRWRWQTGQRIRKPLIERHVSMEWLQVGLGEAKNVDTLNDEVRHASPMPDVPLIVLCSMGTDELKRAVSVGESESLMREEIEGKRRLYTRLAESVPRGEVRLVDAGHVTMHYRHPEADPSYPGPLGRRDR